jgi:hypothetical protein
LSISDAGGTGVASRAGEGSAGLLVWPAQAELSRLAAGAEAVCTTCAWLTSPIIRPTGKQADRPDCGQCTPYNNAFSLQPAADGVHSSWKTYRYVLSIHSQLAAPLSAGSARALGTTTTQPRLPLPSIESTIGSRSSVLPSCNDCTIITCPHEKRPPSWTRVNERLASYRQAATFDQAP